jgi:hypothetical protein
MQKGPLAHLLMIGTSTGDIIILDVESRSNVGVVLVCFKLLFNRKTILVP